MVLKFNLTWINKLDEFFEYGLLDHATLVQTLRHLVEVDDGTNIFAQLLDLQKRNNSCCY